MQRKFIETLSKDKVLVELIKQYFKLKHENYVNDLMKIMIDNGFLLDAENKDTIDYQYNNLVSIFDTTYEKIKDDSLKYDYCYLYHLFAYSKLIYKADDIIVRLRGLQCKNNHDVTKLFKYYKYQRSEYYLSSMYAIHTLLNNFYYEFLCNDSDKYNYELYKIQEWMNY